ncbi:MAG: hypothetical protein OEY56_07685, partial [Cyclobacteriaceae bacterium]|nr:hypothetical protein [Cyclobacteriaceae bacterium]
MSEPKIELHQIRDFGAKINVTIEYIRQNFAPLMKLVLLVAVPLSLLFGILLSDLFGSMISMSQNPDMDDVEALGFLGKIGTSYLAMVVLSMVTYAFMLSGIYGYMKLNQQQEVRPTPSDVIGAVLGKIPGVLGLMLLISVVTVLGFFLFIIPGIYLMVTLSLAIPIYLFEDQGIGEAFGRSFRLIREKWWRTFGLLFVASMIAG